MIAVIDSPLPALCSLPPAERLCVAFSRCADFTMGHVAEPEEPPASGAREVKPYHFTRCARDDQRRDCLRFAACDQAYVDSHKRGKPVERWACPTDGACYEPPLVAARALVRPRPA